MKRGIKCIILICMIAIIGGCSSNNKKNNTNSDLEKQSKINIEDIDWKVKQGIVDGDRYALLDYTNNTPYTITHFELTFEEKDDLKEEDKEKFYKHIKDVVNADDEGMEEIKNKKIEFYAKSNRIVNKNKTVKNQRVYYYSGIYYLQDASYINLADPSTATIEYISNDKIHKAYYDYKSKEYTEDEKTEKAIYWTQGTFKDKLPKPKAQVIKKDYIDNKKSFSFVACGLTKDDYDSYVDKCKKMGYTVDADNFDDSYYAKNSEGYKIDIRYDADDFELNVSISAPSTNNENQNTTDTTDDDQEIDEED